mgnify:CR=1 FL=1|jgi:excisionase family DNA binding protein
MNSKETLDSMSENLLREVDLQAYTYSQVAELLASSKDTVIRMCVQGKLQRIYLRPRSPRIPKWSIDRFLEQQNTSQYDGQRTTASAINGESVWLRSIKEKNQRIGTRCSSRRKVAKLADQLVSRRKENSENRHS